MMMSETTDRIFESNTVQQGLSYDQTFGCSLTDITLEQAVRRLQEIQKDNNCLRDNLRQHNRNMKEQYEELVAWKKREQEKNNQTKAVITALKEECQELQVKVMTKEDKVKSLESNVTTLEEEKAHLMRQKALSDQKAINIEKQAEKQGITGLNFEEGEESDAVVFVDSVDKENTITELETSLEKKDDLIASLRAELLKKEEELSTFKDSTKQLLEDMEQQQKMKEAVEQENRTLHSQILQAEKKLHQHMQSVIQNTKRELNISLGADAQRPLLRGDETTNSLKFPESMEDLGQSMGSMVAVGVTDTTVIEDMKRQIAEERKCKDAALSQVEELELRIRELNVSQRDTEQMLREVRQEAQETADRLGSEYEKKLMDVAQQSSVQEAQSIKASNTEDMSIMRSQVLTLIKEVDEKQSNLTAALAAISNKDSRIQELEQMNRQLQQEYSNHWQKTHDAIGCLNMQLEEQKKSQQENTQIKEQHLQLQMSFNNLVTDYKELVEMFETQKAEGQRNPGQYNKDLMEELNRLTAQVMAADEAIAVRDEQIAHLRNQAQSGGQNEEIQLLLVQAELYKKDFEAERDARRKLVEERDILMEQVTNLRERINLVTAQMEGHNQRQISDIQRRLWQQNAGASSPPGARDGSDRLRATPPIAHDYRQHGATFQPPGGPAMHHFPPDNDEPQSLQRFNCPTCNSDFPDLDSLQLHVTECIDNAN